MHGLKIKIALPDVSYAEAYILAVMVTKLITNKTKTELF